MMISETLAKDIAGEILIEEFDKDFLRKNVGRLYVDRRNDDNRMIVSFGMFKDEIEDSNINNTNQIHNDSVFPDIFLKVAINMLNGNGEVLEKSEIPYKS